MHVSIYTYCICISERVLHWIGVHLLTFLFFPRGFVVSSKSNNGVDCVLWSKQVVGSGKFISFGYLHLVGYIYIYILLSRVCKTWRLFGCQTMSNIGWVCDSVVGKLSISP